jgi:hypothetical protein
MPREIRTITVGDLRRELEAFPDDWELTFGGVLEFHRTKARGPKTVDIEFNQSVWRDSKTGVFAIEDPR